MLHTWLGVRIGDGIGEGERGSFPSSPDALLLAIASDRGVAHDAADELMISPADAGVAAPVAVASARVAERHAVDELPNSLAGTGGAAHAGAATAGADDAATDSAAVAAVDATDGSADAA